MSTQLTINFNSPSLNKDLPSLLELSSDSFLLISSNGKIFDCNNNSLKLFDCQNKNDICIYHFWDIVAEDDREYMTKLIDRLFLKKEMIIEGIHFIDFNGNEIPSIFKAIHCEQTPNTAIISIQDLRRKKDLEVNILAKIDSLSKETSFIQQIRKSKSSYDLKKIVCNHGIKLSDANEIWFLHGDNTNFVFGHTSEHPSIDKDIPIPINTIHFNIKELINQTHSSPLQLKDNLITLPFFNDSDKIIFQQISSKKFKNNRWIIWGFNYYQPLDDENRDSIFISNVSDLVFTALDILISYENLVNKEVKFRALTENIEGVIGILDTDLKFTFISPSIKKVNMEIEDFIGCPIQNFLPSNEIPKILKAVNKIRKEDGASKILPEVKFLIKDGLAINTFVIMTNHIAQKEIGGIVINIRNIDETSQFDDKMRQNEKKFQNIFNSSNDVIVIADMNGNIFEVNNVAIQRLSITKEEFLTLNIRDIFKHIPESKINFFINQLITNESATDQESYINSKGERVFFEVNGRVIDFQGKKVLLFRSINITERKQNEQLVLQTIIKTQEKEQSRFARELHDGIGPYLSAINFFLKTLSIEDDKAQREIILNKAIASLNETIRSIKDISNNLSPQILNHFGIVTAVKSFVNKISNNSIPINIQSNMETMRFDNNMEISLFRIFTELINNSLKYADATKIDISILNQQNEIIIEYRDNGKGFDYISTIKAAKGSGLYNILNRVNSLMGKYDINSHPNKGFYFIAEFIIN